MLKYLLQSFSLIIGVGTFEPSLNQSSIVASGAVFTELTYEGYGPGGVAVLVECLTDNTNRTAAAIKQWTTVSGDTQGSKVFWDKF